MRKISIIVVICIIITSCISSSKQVVNEISKESVRTNLSDLSIFIEPKWDNTYNFRHDRIQLPQNYKELVWKTEFGAIEGNKTDTVYLKYLIYGDKLDSLIHSHEGGIHYTEFQKYYGRPSLLSTTRNGKITDFNYLFNSKRHPNCSCSGGVNNYLGGNCRILDFEFNDNGYLISVHKSMFSF